MLIMPLVQNAEAHTERTRVRRNRRFIKSPELAYIKSTFSKPHTTPGRTFVNGIISAHGLY